MKYLILLIVAIIIIPKKVKNEPIDMVKHNWDEFCKVYIIYVDKYPMSFSAGCCDFNHPSNDRLKIEYLGDKFEKQECV